MLEEREGAQASRIPRYSTNCRGNREETKVWKPSQSRKTWSKKSEKHQGPETSPEINSSKKGKQRHFSNCKALKWISWLRENPDAKDKPKEK